MNEIQRMTDKYRLILGIETSCDETSAAIVTPDSVLSNIISSQVVHINFFRDDICPVHP